MAKLLIGSTKIDVACNEGYCGRCIKLQSHPTKPKCILFEKNIEKVTNSGQSKRLPDCVFAEFRAKPKP
jgi:hypothetical protein